MNSNPENRNYLQYKQATELSKYIHELKMRIKLLIDLQNTRKSNQSLENIKKKTIKLFNDICTTVCNFLD